MKYDYWNKKTITADTGRYQQPKPKPIFKKPEPKPAPKPLFKPMPVAGAPINFLGNVGQSVAPTPVAPIPNPRYPTQEYVETRMVPQFKPNELDVWIENSADPLAAARKADHAYQEFKANADAIQAKNNKPEDKPKTYSDWMGYNPFSNAFADVLGIGWEDPGINPKTAFGSRYIQGQSAPTFMDTYRSRKASHDEYNKANQISLALEKAAPLMQPITDEQGNVLAPAAFTPQEYITGIEDGSIYDPNMPDSQYKYGKTALVYENGQLIPSEVWYRSRDRLLSGNYYQGFTDTEGLGYTHFEKSYLPNTTRSSLATAKWYQDMGITPPALPGPMGPTRSGAPGPQWIRDPLVSTENYDLAVAAQQTPYPFANVDQNLRPGLPPGSPPTEYLLLPALQPEVVQEPIEEPVPGGGGGGGGWGGGYAGFGPSYWGNPSSSGYYGGNNYGPNYWGNTNGYGSAKYSGSNAYGSNYQSNQYGLRKGQYFSNLARWVI